MKHYASAPYTLGDSNLEARALNLPVAECLCSVVSNEWVVNDEYMCMALEAPPKALTAQAGQFFQVLCPSPDEGGLWVRRPMSIYQVDRARRQIEFMYKCIGRGTKGMGQLVPGDELSVVGPLGNGFSLDPAWRNIVVLGRGVGLATLAPISQLAAERAVGVTAILSARNPKLVMSTDVFQRVGADLVTVTDSDGSSATNNVESIIESLISDGRADAFFVCGSNRLLSLMKKLGKKHGIPGQVAMEQIMACGLGPCYICVRTFEVDGKKVLRRVCKDGPVFDMQEAVAW